MKQLLFLSILILICITIDAQSSWRKARNMKISRANSNDTARHKLNLSLLNNHALNFPQGKLLYETEKGKVYALPPDNILCLVPEYHSKMGVLSSHGAFTEPMPNPLPRTEMIPKH